MKKQKLKLISLLMIITLVMTAFIPKVNAEPDLTKTEGSLKITKYEVGDKGQLPLKGVTFDIYKIDDNATSTELPTSSEVLATKQSKETGTDGVAMFSNLALGRYLVVESNAPANVATRIANFIVDVPMTSADGTSLIYDVEVSPKNNTVYGGVVLQKVDSSNNQGMADVEFELQKQDGTNWVKYGEVLATADGTTDKNAAGTVLEKGKIEVTGLPAGTYRFVEKTTLDGYILDNKTTYPFNVSLGDDGQTIVDNSFILVKNDKPVVSKEITSDLTNGSVDIGDTVSYKVTTTVPSTIDELKTFEIEETLDEGLTYTDGSVEVNAIDSENQKTSLQLGVDYRVETGTDNTVKIVITDSGKTKLDGKTNLEIEYDVVLNENADATTLGNESNTEFTYSTIVEKDYTNADNVDTTETIENNTTVYTGGLFIKKVDNEGNVIPTGATFKIATSEANAKNGIYIDGIELTTGTNGYVSYKGLEYGQYWLVETKAPTYEDTNSDGEEVTKVYNLLRRPVEITVNNSTYSEGAAIEIINKKGFELPATGAMGSLVVSGIGIAVIGLGIKSYKGKEEK